MKLAKRLQNLGTENAFTTLAKINKLKAEGKEIIVFSIGEPDFDTPRNIIDAAHKALDSGMTHYTPSQGYMDFRKAIAEYISKTRQISVVPEEVVVVPGGKPIIFHSILACVDEGDEVLCPSPGYPIYESVINFVGAKAVHVPILESKNFSIDVDSLEKLITPKTTFMVINSPHNPTGGSIPRKDLERIAELCIKHDITVLSDEIYSRLIFDGEHSSIASIPGMKERTIILDGMSKTYAMTGWRLGYGVMPAKIAEAVTQLVTNDESCTATFTQVAGIEALMGSQKGADDMKETFRKRRDIIVEELRKVGLQMPHAGRGFLRVPERNRGLQDDRVQGLEGAVRQAALRSGSSRPSQDVVRFEGPRRKRGIHKAFLRHYNREHHQGSGEDRRVHKAEQQVEAFTTAPDRKSEVATEPPCATWRREAPPSDKRQHQAVISMLKYQ